MWVAPLRSEMRGQFDPEKNPLLKHCKYQLFLLIENGKTIGRIAAFIDTLAVDYWGEKIGLFGYYECPDDPQASAMLLDQAREWLIEKGMTAMRGPWSFVSQEWGSVVEGFSPPPVVMSPYNPPFYNDHFDHFGLNKAKDLLVYYIDAGEGYQIPERIMTLTDKVAERYGIRVRPLDMDNYEQEVQTVINLSNDSLAVNWGYSPVTEEEVKAMARDLKPIIHPKAVMFAMDQSGRPVGFAIAIPDINQLIRGLNGRMFPIGIFRLLFGLPRLKAYRMFALGVIPEYHGKGIDSLIYRAMYESCYSPKTRLEINYILEDNYPMNNAVLKLGAKPLRLYRVYQKSI
jgi:GNAT superfamily N-acetyltransferase